MTDRVRPDFIMHWTLIICVSIGTWIAWSSISLLRHYRLAKTIKLPIVISPVSSINPAWILLYKVLCPSIIPALRSLPIGKWPRCTYMGWQFEEKYQIHDELGPAFVLCTPGLNEVLIADPTAAHHVLAKRKDFVKPAALYEALNVFGRNLDTVEGETWQRHRKLTAPNFNERVSASVWSESIRQANQMLARWMKVNDGNGTRDAVDDTAALALNVLSHAGFGITSDFEESHTTIDQPHTLSYRQAIQRVLQNFTLLAIFPLGLLHLPFLPRTIKAIASACDEFKLYMKETVDREKQHLAQTKNAVTSDSHTNEAHNLLTALVRASSTAGTDHQGLTDKELYGNIFIYNLAGHETTANTIATAIAYLAAAPKWQDWLREELQSVLPTPDSSPDDPDPIPSSTSQYDTIFPHLPRTLAIMHETLRLHGSLPFIPKTTLTQQTIQINGQPHTIPAGTFTIINSQALHCDPRIWGPDPLIWRPDRWLSSSPTPSLIDPRPGSFVAWADGPRVCPGRKFSQVEFVAVLSVLFKGHRVVPTVGVGDEKAGLQATNNDIHARVQAIIDDSAISAITLQMKRPRDVVLKWERV